jgi:protocatechuate 3,4-dioxygenase beta subunit
VALALGTIPGSVLRPIVFERVAVPLPASSERTARIDLVVRAAADRRPVARAEVRVFSMVADRAYLAGSGQTDGQGRVEVGALPGGAAWVLVNAEGWARASTQRILTGETMRLEVELVPAHRLTVTVADDLGEPVEGAEVEVSSGDPLPVGARTDGRGVADVTRLGEGPWIVSAHAVGYETVVARGVAEGARPRLVLHKMGSLVVKVLRAGDPAPSAQVQVAGGALWPPRTADVTHGTVRIGALPAGSYALRASDGAWVSSTEIGVVLGRGEEREVVLTLVPGVFATARVMDGSADDAQPIAHARVTLVEGGVSPFPMEAVSDQAGTARLGPFASGPASLLVEADGFVPRGAVDAPQDGRTVTVVLDRAGVVEGRVVDARGRPIDGATIEIVGSTSTGAPIDDDPVRRSFRRGQFDARLGGAQALIPSGELGVVPGPVPAIPHGSESAGFSWNDVGSGVGRAEPWVSRADGTFRAAPASPGRVRVLARHPEFLEALSEVVSLAPGGSATVDVVLRTGGVLEGRVVDASGRPVPGAMVTLAALRGTMERVTHSATDGTFAFAAVPDEVLVTATPSDGSESRAARSTAQIPEGGTATVTLALPDPRPSLSVSVRDDRGYAIEAAQISAGSVDPAVPLRTTVFTDAHGEVSLPGARGVALRLEVSAPRFAGQAVQVGTTEAEVRVQLEPAQVLVGTVRERRTGVPIRMAEVSFQGSMGVRRTETDAAGRFKLGDLEAGAGHLVVRAQGRVPGARDVTLSRGSSRAEDVGFLELDEEGVVEGTVVDAKGDAVPGARVGKEPVPTYLPMMGNDASFVVADARGRFHLGGLEEGDVSIEAYAADVGRGRASGVRVRSGRTTRGVVVRLAAEAGERVVESAAGGGVAVTLGETSGEPPEVVIVAVAVGSEAERAGLAAGDAILTVDGVAVRTIVAARERLSGPLGEDVVVVRRRGDATDAIRVARERVRR